MTVSEPTARERFEHLFEVISSERFLKKEGLGKEVPFFICAFSPDHAFDMKDDIQRLENRLKSANVRILHVDLYDMSINILKERDILDQLFAIEASTDKSDIKDLLQGVLDPADHIVPRIAEAITIEPHDVIFLTGVGEIFPYIRSHNILNNLQSTATDRPTVMFFPGEYTHSLSGGASLDLFGKLHDDKYYRAFNIMNYEV